MTSNTATTLQKTADPCCLVIFGATGDLTRRLLIPALYNLAAGGLLPEGFAIIGIGRTKLPDDAFRNHLAKGLRDFATGPIDNALADRMLACVTHVQGEAEDPQTYDSLQQELEHIERARPTRGNRLFYLAVPPTAFASIGCGLGRSGLTREEKSGWRRIIIEKPFGTDLASARALNRKLLEVLQEHQIYRIDHYLGKETVRNILVLRFANGLFEPIWNRDHIDHVQITVAETLTVGRRGLFYDATGALRDMVPNHLFQLLSFVAMEPPARFYADAVRAAKADILDATQPPLPVRAGLNFIRAQYEAGRIGNEAIGDYRNTRDVRPDSTTETYIALKLMVDNWRWAGVPFYLRTGKALKSQSSEVAIKFKQAPLALFRDTLVDRLAENFLVLGIQPDECITLQFNAKAPGPSITVAGVGMTFKYSDYFDTAPKTGYETLIYDCMIGDAILFRSADEIEAGWRAVQPFIDAWAASDARDLVAYRAGTEGPPEADRLLAQDGRRWRPLA